MTKIEITAENVDALVEEYADLWWTADELDAAFLGMSKKSIQPWALKGEIRREEILPRPKHQAWYRYNVADAIIARHSRRKCMPFLRRRKNDGRMEMRCNVCLKWQDEDEFYDNPRPDRDNHNKLTYCKGCHNERSKKRREKDPFVRMKERERSRAHYRKLKNHRIQAEKFKPIDRVPAQRIIDLIDRRFPDKTEHSDAQLCQIYGLEYELIRTIRRRAREGANTMLEQVDTLFSALNWTDDLSEIYAELDEGRPTWHPDHAFCQRCFRTNVSYMARGLCSTCYRHRNDADYRPPVQVQSWSLRYPCCQSCHRTDRKHAARGLCGTCWQRKRKAGELEAGMGREGRLKTWE